VTPHGQALAAMLTDRGMVMTAPAPQPQPVNPVAAQLSDRPQAPPSLADQVNHLAAMHTEGHPHMTGHEPVPEVSAAEHIPLPNNPLSGVAGPT
jgi:hypothetical protein